MPYILPIAAAIPKDPEVKFSLRLFTDPCQSKLWKTPDYEF